MTNRGACSGTRHGDSNAYRNHGCRCPDAARDNTRYGKRRRAGLHQPKWVSSVGVARRRQALAALGYGLEDLVPYFNTTSARGVGNYSARTRVHRATFERWAAVYDLLSMTPGPNENAKAYARRAGWPPPLAWDDDEIDNPDAKPAQMPRVMRAEVNHERVAAALAGDEAARTALSTPDRHHIVRQLHAEGLTDPEIVARSGMPKRTVRYIRHQLCLLTNYEPHARRRLGFDQRVARAG